MPAANSAETPKIRLGAPMSLAHVTLTNGYPGNFGSHTGACATVKLVT